MKTLFLRLAAAVVLFIALFTFLSREPNFVIAWNREVPSKESAAVLSAALNDPRNWSVIHHALKSVTLFENGQALAVPNRVASGMTALFAVEPKGKEWKRFDVRAEVLAVQPGEWIRFRLLEESSGKTARVVDGLEWEVGFLPGTPNRVYGSASARTKNARARFFGRVTPKILMNQLYPFDLVRFANFTAVAEANAKGTEPVYR